MQLPVKQARSTSDRNARCRLDQNEGGKKGEIGARPIIKWEARDVSRTGEQGLEAPNRPKGGKFPFELESLWKVVNQSGQWSRERGPKNPRVTKCPGVFIHLHLGSICAIAGHRRASLTVDTPLPLSYILFIYLSSEWRVLGPFPPRPSTSSPASKFSENLKVYSIAVHA